MNNIKTNIKTLTLFAGAILLGLGFFTLSQGAFAQQTPPVGNVFNGLLNPGGVSEYGVWSDNIGWISLNSCPDDTGVGCGPIDYGVNYNESTGVLSGSAWSSNVGWITFDATADIYQGYTACPGGAAATPSLATNVGNGDTFKGFARAVVADPNGPFWDGCISLSSINETNPASTYGVRINFVTNELEGSAWGGEVLGWISFNANIGENIVPQTPSATLYVSGPNPINPGTPTELTWSSANVTNCAPVLPNNGDAGWVQSPNPIIPASAGTFNTANLNQTTDYAMICDPVDTANFTSFTVTTTVDVSQYAITLTSDDYVANLNSQGEYEDALTWTSPVSHTQCVLNETNASGQVLGPAQIISGGQPVNATLAGNTYPSTDVEVTNDPSYYKIICQNGNAPFSESNLIQVNKDAVNPFASITGPSCVQESQPASGWVQWTIQDILDIDPGACTLSFGGNTGVISGSTDNEVATLPDVGAGVYTLTCQNPLYPGQGQPATLPVPPANTHTIQELPDNDCVYNPPPTTTNPNIIFIEI